MSDDVVEILCEWGEEVHLYDIPCNRFATILRCVPFTEAIGDPSDRTTESYMLCDIHAEDDAKILHINPKRTDERLPVEIKHDGD